MVACSPPQVRQGQIQVSVIADGKPLPVDLPAGSTVQDALDQAGLPLGTLDRSDPPLYTLLRDGSAVTITRIREEFEVEQVVIPFERQVLRNESLPEGETRLSQPGANGLQEITYRRVFEDDVLVTESMVRSVIVEEPVAEIVMVGSRAPFAAVTIPGRLAYLSAGNAWIMEGSTGNRRPLVSSGDLDGRVFSLSPDGEWLLFSRKNQEKDSINTLWVARVEEGADQIIDLEISNVIHFARFNPDSNRIAYSTVESRTTPPGWQANNELSLVALSPSGFVAKPVAILDANAGGVYGWWGMDFAWASDGVRLAYTRPDSIGIYDTRLDILQPLVNISPLQTGGDWAWVPGVSWSPDENSLFTVQHIVTEGSTESEGASRFDLLAIPLSGGTPVSLVKDVGMFAYPIPSPLTSRLRSEAGEAGEVPVLEVVYRVAYLQAMFPAQSDSSRYRLFVIDRDGSNKVALFPSEGATGLEPQRIVWSPTPLEDNGHYASALLVQGNIWFVDAVNSQAQQITGDGLTVRIDWR